MKIDQKEKINFKFTGWDKKIIEKASIMVVGAGALGNEVLKNLALLGVGKIFLADFDKISKSNLTRSVLFREGDEGKRKVAVAAKRAKAINPAIHIVPFHGDILHHLGLGVYRKMDVVIGCVDNGEARLKINQSCWKTNTLWIDGGLHEFAGVVRAFKPPTSSCYECTMTKLDYQLINLRYSCQLLTQEGLVEGATPTTPTISSIIGGIQAHEAIKHLHGLPIIEGKGITYNGLNNDYFMTIYPRKEDCLSHEGYDNIIELDESAEELTIQQMLNIARKHLGAKAVIELEYEFVQKLICPKCGRIEKIMAPIFKISNAQNKCKKCHVECNIQMTHNIKGDEKFVNMTLFEIGIPLLDIIVAKHDGRYAYFELSKDVRKVMNYL